MTALPSFTVTADVNEIISILTGGELTETPPEGSSITFTCSISSRFILTWESRIFPVPRPVTATVTSDGMIQNSGGGPVKLLANDTGLNATSFKWKARLSIPGYRLRPWEFIAPNDGATFDLATVIPEAESTGGGGLDGGSPGGSGPGLIDGGSP
jgi:hypothetical protein